MYGKRSFSNAVIFLFIFMFLFSVESSVYADNRQTAQQTENIPAAVENTDGSRENDVPEPTEKETRKSVSKASYMCFIGTSALLAENGCLKDFAETAFRKAVVKNMKKQAEKKKTEAKKEREAQKTEEEKTVFPDASKPMVALTFDDGPYTPVTDRILAQLEAYHAHATFFVVGNRVGTYADSVRRAVQDGCQIGTHSYDHEKLLTALTTTQIQTQMHDTDVAVAYYVGVSPILMRPVGGEVNNTVKSAVGKPLINWSIDTLDWKTKDAASVQERVLNYVQDGDIILMHDLYTSTADACDVLIPELINRGYQLVTVSELAAAKGVNLKNGTVYRYFR